MRHKIESGQRFGRLVCTGQSAGPPLRWEANCDCGGIAMVRAGDIHSGRVKSCGCLERESRHTTIKHGHARIGHKHPLYAVWASMIDRCENPNNSHFASYGGRGVKVCERWRKDFGSFLEDVGPKPSPSHSIDRRDNDGHYEPANVRWATPMEQAANTSRSRFVEVNGNVMHQTAAARLLSVSPATITRWVQCGRMRRVDRPSPPPVGPDTLRARAEDDVERELERVGGVR